MKWLESWLTTYFFWRLYKKYSRTGWALVCRTPLLNLAFPDDSVQYFLCSFARGDRVRLVGSVPPRHLVAYSAFTVYDTKGVPIASLYDNEWPTRGGRYEIVVGRHMKVPSSSSYYCIIMRLYMAQSQSPLRLDLTPSLIVRRANDECEETLPELSVENIVENSEAVGQQVLSFLSKRAIPAFSTKQAFYAPKSSEMASFFVNQNAVYMIAAPGPDRVLCVTGERYSRVGRDHDIRFMGFMACNLKTTATDASVGWALLPRHYRLWVAYSEKEARDAGYPGGSSEPLLLWKRSNAFPILVYREVRVDHRGLIAVTQQEDRRIEAPECQRIMGRFYPRVE